MPISKTTLYQLVYSSGESLASGSADKNVIIWGDTPFEGKLKYSHSESVQRLAYNPKTALLLSCTNVDFGM